MFVPRCLLSGPAPPPSPSRATRTTAIPPPAASTSEEDIVKGRCEQQRAVEPGEPACVICGRYGEYICDETDEDVCSTQCKRAAIERFKCINSAIPPPPSSSSSPSPSSFKNAIYFQDDCIYVKDHEQKLPARTLTNHQTQALRKEIGVDVIGEDSPPPILDFTGYGFPKYLQRNLELAGYDCPTPIQMQAIPAALSGRDILVNAGTGSGKTASFLLPIIQRCCLIRRRSGVARDKPLVIVMTPTRELCAQVEEQAKLFGKGLPFKTALVVGGDALPQQLYRIKQGIELIVGTPGRLVDLLIKHPIDLDDVCILVLDEVDCMLERGFRDQVMQIVQALSQPQIMMFSATIPSNIKKFATSILKRHLFISAAKASLPSEAVKQTVIWVEPNRKKQKLFEIIESASHFHPPAVVFVNSRAGADLLAESVLHVTGLKASALHGEKLMSERRETLRSFLMGELPVIVATGVLSRGLDLIRVRQVIVFDMPKCVQDYIHQIGRASRLGLPGNAIVLINNEDKGVFKEFIGLLRSSGATVPRELSNSPYACSSYAVAYNCKKRKH